LDPHREDFSESLAAGFLQPLEQSGWQVSALTGTAFRWLALISWHYCRCSRHQIPFKENEMTKPSTALIIGASRGLGLALTGEYLKRGWHVIATVRDKKQHTALHDLQSQVGRRLEIEHIDITIAAQIPPLRQRLDGHQFDLLFVNAGVSNNPDETISEVSTEEFNRVMATNALAPLRVIEQLINLVTPSGQVGAMSSELGSIEQNTTGGWEVYRASKAALNMLMRSLIARRAGERRTFMVVAPGWVRTDMGGSAAPLDIETSIPAVVDAIHSRRHAGALSYFNYQNATLPW
jgi:NAD(P)-dependent dehydrogenase (short-subunit alcohol dehydrogenase family)